MTHFEVYNREVQTRQEGGEEYNVIVETFENLDSGIKTTDKEFLRQDIEDAFDREDKKLNEAEPDSEEESFRTDTKQLWKDRLDAINAA